MNIAIQTATRTEPVVFCHWMHRSQAFLHVVSMARASIPRLVFTRSVALWCRGQPSWYSDWVFRELSVLPINLQSSSESIASRISYLFASRLFQRHRSAAFLLSDAQPLAKAYEACGGEVVDCGLSRDSLPHPSDRYYLDLFDIVNQAALAAYAQGHQAFLEHYAKRLYRYLKTASELSAVLEAHARELASSSATAVADTGMQGTFALPLAVIFTKLTGRQMDPCLAVAYPWLRHLLGYTTVSADARVLVALERMKADGLVPRPDRPEHH